MVQHFHIEFINDVLPVQSSYISHRFNQKEKAIIDKEISKLLKLKVIEKVQYDDGQFISPIFLRLKKNGEYRLILNLKKLNEFIPYHHFKMETFEVALSMVTRNMYMCTLDLRHAYYSVPIAIEHQKYLRFIWNDNFYAFTCCPNGLACVPLKFTKLLKPVYAKLRVEGHICTGFIDDSLLGGNTQQSCLNTVDATSSLMQSLGFMINDEKSMLVPVTKICYLGNNIDSVDMTVSLPDEKKNFIYQECCSLFENKMATIRKVAHVIGLIVASFSAVEFARLHYRNMERSKIKALKKSKGDFDAFMVIPLSMKCELKWWIDNVHTQYRSIDKGNPQLTIQTDASLSGWGAVCNSIQIGGRWTSLEKTKHINELELLAILFSLQAFKIQVNNKHVKVLSDSSTAVCYVTNMGGMKSIPCDLLSGVIWQFCIENKVWLSCSHIAGKSNPADKPSRTFNDRTEWSLNDKVFDELCKIWKLPDIDLFASRLNKKLVPFCAWTPDPEAKYIDAFTLDWGLFQYAYIFPPFSLLNRCICKIQQDKASALVIAPVWPTQVWFATLLKLLVEAPKILPRKANLLKLPHLEKKHPLSQKLVLMACKVSGERMKNKDFQSQLPVSSCRLGEIQQNANISVIFRDGFSTVLDGKFLQFQFL